MSKYAILVGGPFNGQSIPLPIGNELQIAYARSDRMPKEQRHAKGWWSAIVYRKTEIIRNGKVIFRFQAGYYSPPIIQTIGYFNDDCKITARLYEFKKEFWAMNKNNEDLALGLIRVAV